MKQHLRFFVLAFLMGQFLHGCTTACDVTSTWQNSTSTGCTSCLSANCGSQAVSFGIALLNRSVCSQTMWDCYNACRTREAQPDSPRVQCRCAAQCTSGECGQRINEYFTCAVSNCNARCQ